MEKFLFFTKGSGYAQKMKRIFARACPYTKRIGIKLTRPRWKLIPLSFAIILLVAELATVVKPFYENSRYDLAAAKALVTPTADHLRAKIRYDQKQGNWLFNENAQQELPGVSDSATKVGGVGYSAQLPLNANSEGGLKLSDERNKLDVSFKPDFKVGDGKLQEGYLVYPLRKDDAQLVYTFAQDGVKEDIILHSAAKDTASFSYSLSLPDSLEARLQHDGSVGIFGGDATLFGNISYGSDKDRALVEKARENSRKTTLYYVIPAPVVKGDGANGVKTAFVLDGDKLTVQVSGLKSARYPLSIDPSFVMDTSGCSWQKNGNNEGNMNYAGCQLVRSGLSGGTLGAWNAANNGTAGFARINSNVTAYNGYLYVAGGQTVGSPNVQLNDVSFARICDGVVATSGCSAGAGNAGKLGNWASASNSFVGARNQTQVLGYDGYLYIIGGYSTGNTAFDDAQYALICTGSNAGVGGCGSTPGDVGTWLYANGTGTQAGSTGVDGSKLNARAANSATFAYNGRVYVIGGCNTLPVSACNANANTTTQVASFQGNGTLSTWSNSSAGIPSSLYIGGGAVAYNNYAYVLGGCSSKNGLNQCNGWNSYRVVINSDGTLGTWSSLDQQIPLSQEDGTAGVSQGYLYYAVGNSTNQVYMAKIYADGTTGPWASTTAYGTARYSTDYAFYGGYVYLVDGCTNNSLNCQSPNGSTNDVRYSQISTAPGSISAFTTESDQVSATPDGIRRAAVAVYGGYIYLVGGITSGGNNRSAVTHYAKLNNDGSTGAWTASANQFTDGRAGAAAVAYNGYLYVVGGDTGGNPTTNCPQSGLTGYCKDIQKTPINSSTGAIGAWSSAGSFYGGSSTGRSMLAATVYNGYIYVIGGEDGGSAAIAQIDVGQIDTSNGNIVSWTNNTSGLGSNARSTFGLTRHGSHLYVVGGFTTGNALTTSVLMATLSNGGGISAFTSAGADFTTGRAGQVAQVYNNYLYVIGGRTSTSNGAVGSNDVQYAKLNADGTIAGGWTASPMTFTTSRVDNASAMYNGFLYTMGGCSSLDLIGGCGTAANNLKDVQYTQIYNGGGGVDGAWVTGPTSSTLTRYAPMTVVSSGYMIIMGGCTTVLVGSCTVIGNSTTYAPINANGSLGSWTNGTTLPQASLAAGAATANGYVYLVGGCTSGACSSTQNTVYSALVCTGNNNGTDGCGATAGTLGTWHTLNTISARWATAAVVVNGYLYVAGGIDGAGANLSDVQSAQILPNGGLGSWGSVGSGANFTTARGGHSLVSYGNYLYILGGTTGSVNLSDVQVAQVQSGGQLGAWSATTGMPATSFLNFAGAANGYMYYAGIRNSAFSNQTMYAPIMSDGTLGSWASTTGNTNGTAVAGFAGAIYNGYMYRAGGWDTGGLTTGSYYAPLLSTPQIARHSMLLTTDARTQPASFFGTVGLQSGNAVVRVGNWTAADPAVTLNNLGTTDGVTSGTKYQLVSGNDGTKYYWVTITMDDGQSMTWGETAGSSMSYLQLNYIPNPGLRLRGGKTFNDNVQQSLDAR